MTDKQREIKRQPTTNIQGMAAANSVSAQSLVMRNQITASAIDIVHVPNRKYGHFGHSASSVVWIGITISVFSANAPVQRRRHAVRWNRLLANPIKSVALILELDEVGVCFMIAESVEP